MEFKNFENVPCIWKPPGDKGEYYSKFVELVEEKYKIKIENYWDLHKWSVENIDKFWGELWYFTGIKYSKTFNQVIDLSIPLSQLPKWFIGAELNFAENILRHRDDHVAIVAIGEDREKRIITYAEMYEEVKRYTSAFRKIGLKKGDIIVGYTSNREEIIFAMLGANAIGAVFTGVLPLLGAQAILDRLKLVRPTILISVDRLRYNQEEINMLPKLQEITKGLPTLMKTIIVPSKPDSEQKDIGSIAKSCFLKEFLDLADDPLPDIVFEQVAFSHPIIISYTSGTTGPPKALIHDFGSILSSVRDQCLLSDFNRRGRSLSVSPPGWASWLFSIFSFYSGSSTVLFDGEPYLLSPTYLWDMIDEHKITGCFISPKNLDDLEKRNYVPTEKHKLTSLFAIFAAASIVKPQNYDFVCKKIKPGILFCSVYGSTELMSSCISLHRTLPIYRGEIACPSLGADVEFIDETGKSVEGILGDMVIAKPLPGITLGMYGDVDGIKFRENYFSKYPDKFSLGDCGLINPVTKGIIIYCRSDEVLKPGGCRFGSIEIYNVVNLLPEVHDSICVSQYSKNRNERAVLFLKIKEGFRFTDELVKKVQRKIGEELSTSHIPGLILEVPDVPYNINGKKMEVLVKKMINQIPYSTEVVKNKECLRHYLNVPPYED